MRVQVSSVRKPGRVVAGKTFIVSIQPLLRQRQPVTSLTGMLRSHLENERNPALLGTALSFIPQL